MKTSVLTILVLLLNSSLFAQSAEASLSVEPPASAASHKAERASGGNAWSGSSFTGMIAYGSFALSSEHRFGPMIILQYTPNRYWKPAVDLVGGVLIRTGTSGSTDERDYILLANQFSSAYSPSHRPHFSIGLAFLGADMTYYFSEGNVRPYIGVGASFAFWSYLRRFSGALAPSAKGGVDIRISGSFSGFAELRRMFGVATFVGPKTPTFNGLTAAAIGISFEPRLR